MATKKLNTPLFDNAIIAAHDKYFLDCVTDEDFMSAAMEYNKANINVFRAGLPGVQQALKAVTAKYQAATTDEEYSHCAKMIKKTFNDHKCLKDAHTFSGIEYLAVAWISGNHGSGRWAEIFRAKE